MSHYINRKRRLISVVILTVMLMTALPCSAAEEESPILRPGDTGSYVAACQKNLMSLGYYHGEITAEYDDATLDAVLAFQTDSGLTADGIWDAEDMQAMQAALSDLEIVDPYVIVTPTQTPSPTYQNSVIDLTIEPNVTSVYMRLNQYSGDQALLVQQCLTDLGYYKEELHGNYDSATQSAVIAFQRDYNIDHDGIAGPTTLKALYNAVDLFERRAAYTSETPVPTQTAVVSYDYKLCKGQTTSQVYQLQCALAELGFYAWGDEYYYFGEKTYAAVKAFQSANDLDVDGVAGPVTLKCLFGQVSVTLTAPTAIPTGTPSATTTPTETVDYNVILRYGTTSAKVGLLQKALAELGFYVAGSDTENYYGSATKSAVKAFQSQYGLEADGIAGPITLEAVFTKVPDISFVDPTSTPVPVSNYDYLLKKGQTSTQVYQLQQALEELGYYKGSYTDADYYFGDVTFDAVKAFQKDYGLEVDGVAGPITLEAIFSQTKTVLTEPGTVPAAAIPTEGIEYRRYDSGENIPIELLDWYEDDVANVIPRGAYFVLVDVRTGYTMRCKRMGGTNHIDYETATLEDTAVLYACYGHTWKWDRRPVWIIYNGRRFAASTNGMPHGQQTITDNGMNGQVCIHFLNSKTHGSTNVDAAHQACIYEAYEAGGGSSAD